MTLKLLLSLFLAGAVIPLNPAHAAEGYKTVQDSHALPVGEVAMHARTMNGDSPLTSASTLNTKLDSFSVEIPDARPASMPYFKMDNTFAGMHQRQKMTLDEYYKAISIDRFKLLEPEFTTHGTLWTHQDNIDASRPDRALVASILQESFINNNELRERSEKLRHLKLLLNSEIPNPTLSTVQNSIAKAITSDYNHSSVRILGIDNTFISEPENVTLQASGIATGSTNLDAKLALLNSSLNTDQSKKSSQAQASENDTTPSSWSLSDDEAHNSTSQQLKHSGTQDILSHFYSGINDRTTNQDPFDNLSASFGSTTNNDEVFNLKTSIKNNLIKVSFSMRGNAYLYRDSLKIEAQSPTTQIRQPVLPKSEEHYDVQGANMVYFKQLKFEIPLLEGKAGDVVSISFQGCDEQGICYPPQTQTVVLDQDILATFDLLAPHDAENDADQNLDFKSLATGQANEEGISSTLQNNLLLGLLICFLLGIGLDLTPCVLPMLPIFSAMIIGPKKPTVVPEDEFPLPHGQPKPLPPKRKYWNSSVKTLLIQNTAYALGLSLTYMVLGLFFSLLGASFHSVLQSPAVTISIAVLLLLCALACAGVIQLKVPAVLTARLQDKMSKLQTQRFSGAFLLGLISALIASPCTSAPLAGALLYVMTSGNLISGALSFLAIGLGMSFPLFIIGMFGARILRRSGIIGDIVKRILVLALVATAYYMVKRFLGDYDIFAFCLLWYFIIIYTLFSAFFFITKRTNYSSLLILVFSALALVSAYYAYKYYEENNTLPYFSFTRANTVEEIENLTRNRYSIVVFTAEWCSNCHYMEKQVFSKEPFLSQSREFNRIVVDLTNTNDPEVKRIFTEYQIMGVPFYFTVDNKKNILNHQLGATSAEQVSTHLEYLKDHKLKSAQQLQMQMP